MGEEDTHNQVQDTEGKRDWSWQDSQPLSKEPFGTCLMTQHSQQGTTGAGGDESKTGGRRSLEAGGQSAFPNRNASYYTWTCFARGRVSRWE